MNKYIVKLLGSYIVNDEWISYNIDMIRCAPIEITNDIRKALIINDNLIDTVNMILKMRKEDYAILMI